MKKGTGRYRLSKIKITTDPFETDTGFPKSEAVYAILSQLQAKVQKKGIGARQEVYKGIEKYPKFPEFKNLLTTCYSVSGMMDKAYEANKWLRKEHPNYYFGKINYIHELLAEEFFTEAEKELGSNLLLEEFIPSRKIFHVTEFEEYENAVILYFIATKEFDLARNRLDTVGQAFYHKEKLESLEVHLYISENKEKQHAKKEYLTPFFEKYVQYVGSDRSERPNLQFSQELECLFQKNVARLNSADLKSILKLPRETLITDLVAILWDSLHRLVSGSDFDEDYEAQLHAWMLLGELRAEEALPALLDFLRQDNVYLNSLFQDMVHEMLYWSFSRMNLLQHKELLLEFAADKSIYGFNRTIVFQALPYIGISTPELRDDCIAFLTTVLEQCIEDYDPKLDAQPDFPFLACAYLFDLNAREQLPLFEKLMIIFPNIKAEYKNVEGLKQQFEFPFHDHNNSLAWDDIFIAYDHIRKQWYPSNAELVERRAELEARLGVIQVEKTPKKLKKTNGTPERVSRNAPCPCGSGKKYKRCCG